MRGCARRRSSTSSTLRAIGGVAIALTMAVPTGAAGQAPRAGEPANPCVGGGVGSAQSIRLLPVDEAPSRPDFFTFRAHLQAAVARRDESAVIAAADPAIRLSFGGEAGLATFTAQLRDPESMTWAELGAALALGGAFTSATSFAAPYVFAKWPGRADSFECAAVIGDRVRLRQSAAPTSTVIGTASYELVQVLSDTDAAAEVRLATGMTGYIASPFVRRPIAHRAVFDQSSGQWRLAAFIAGD
jgi:hypothetical protein